MGYRMRKDGSRLAEARSDARPHLHALTWWLVIAGLIVTCWVQDGPNVVRHFGAWLQIVGVITVALGLLLEQHPDESLPAMIGRKLRRVRGWFRRLFHLRRGQGIAVSAAGEVEAAGSVHARLTARDDEWDKSMPHDIGAALQRCETLLHDLDKRLENSRDERRAGDAKERAARIAADKQLAQRLTYDLREHQQRVAEQAARPLPIRWAGVWLLLTGIALVSWPEATHQAWTWLMDAVVSLPSWVGVYAALTSSSFVRLQLSG